MHMTRRAPELSATSRLVCIWIMVQTFRKLCRSLGKDFPGLQLGLRRALDDPSDFAFLVDIALIVGVVLLGPAHGLLHHRVQKGPFDLHHHGLVALVGDDHAFENSLRHWLTLAP